MYQPTASNQDTSFILTHFSTGELFELTSELKPGEIEEEVSIFLRRRLGEAIVLEERNEKESNALGFLDNLSS
jgi:hypothetical protein